MNKTVIYTVITNGYDTPNPVRPEPNIDYIMFTDDAELECKGWTIRVTKDPQRRIKLMPHEYLPEYERTLYIDGNMSIINASRFLSQHKEDFVTFKHPIRNCFIDEHYACIDAGKADKSKILDQLAYNIKMGVKPKSGMYQTGVILRRNTAPVNIFCELWYEHLAKYTHRDQLSIMTAVHETEFKPKGLDWNSFFNRHFKITPHLDRTPPKIYYFTPYDTSGNIGKAMNAHCALVTDENAWIAVMDGDVLFPNPQWGKIVESAIMKHGKDYELFGCVTNRVGGEHQRVKGMDTAVDLLEHHSAAMHSREGVQALGNKGIAGYFMLFQKKTWTKCGGFTEKIEEAHQFDSVFNRSVRKIGGRLGLITDLYALHMYRIGHELDVKKAQQNIYHLLANRK